MHNNLYMFIVDGDNTGYDDITDGSPENEFDMVKINKERLLSWSCTKNTKNDIEFCDNYFIIRIIGKSSRLN